jgi:RNA polymerase sigma factor (TIGR02999 family)
MNEDQGNEQGEVTRLLGEVRAGNRQSNEILYDKVYSELRRLAGGFLRNERPGHLLQPTILVHDAYLKLIGQDKTYANRNHFFAIAATLMRRLLVDHARTNRAEKRGGGVMPISLDGGIRAPGQNLEHVLSVDRALDQLAQVDERQSRIVEMKLFAGLGDDAIAEVLNISPRTVTREWKRAKAWLRQALQGASPQ